MGYALQEAMLISYTVLIGILLILKSHFKIKISLLLNKQMQGSQRWQFLLINGHIPWCGRVTHVVEGGAADKIPFNGV